MKTNIIRIKDTQLKIQTIQLSDIREILQVKGHKVIIKRFRLSNIVMFEGGASKRLTQKWEEYKIRQSE